VFASEALVRLWAFWGRRLGDKNFQGALYAVAAGALGTYFAPEQVQAILLILTVVGAFIASPWENMPFEDLSGSYGGGRDSGPFGAEQHNAN
ncbi:MAG TPA: hypothetical protein PKY87_08085, partial [Terricaulis sp.]|nr:hypothetical protein [Terricaulis sp.]